MAALLTRISSRPKRFEIAAIIPSTSARCVTSAATRVPAAVSAIGDELRFECFGRHRLLPPAAKMPLACLSHLARFERDPKVTGKPARIGIVRIDDIAHLACK